MKALDLPFNVELMKLTPAFLASTRPVTSLDYYETAGGDLHEAYSDYVHASLKHFK